jgi:thiol-disulfide isomerase/thioredoxin
MAVHTIVILSFLIAVYNYWGSIPLFPAFGELSVFILPGLLWLFLKPYIIQLKDGEHFKAEYTKLKYNPDIFLALISKQPRINIPQSLKVFTLGNRAAEHELTFVSNPFCGPCVIAHEIIDEWLKQELNFKINIIFIHSNDKNDRQRVFVQHIAKISDQEIFKEIIHAWFSSPGTKDISKWTEEYELQNTELPYDDAHLQEWVNLSEIAATPTFFINGYPLPKTYQLAEIRYLISEVPIEYSDTSLPILQTEII